VKLGTLTLAWDPDKWTIPDARHVISDVDTYSSNVIFFYGEKIVGKQIELEWEWMSQAQFDALDVLFQADLPVVWDLEEALDPRAFTVEILSLDGELFDVALWDQPYRANVKVSLLILSVTEAVLS
jgi:hypothetical protein